MVSSRLSKLLSVQVTVGYANYLIGPKMVLNNENNKEMIPGTISCKSKTKYKQSSQSFPDS